ncbi:MAG: geranylgeranyl reductase family protein [Gemmatimonadales bacterium]|nr:geranylgeranyl reductase family protein [Gemmatimonadales bacterium]NIN11077.1 geranylgeranyl reductase family protein [Gemmatimonadales bacterium]NIN49674.1 geranylgeranyl reductase family protein [Gemmatimonadales bacterium]NIP07138.1 geranylgeranyl reductase family protein [Gemmatimonadales bacterium]NIQ99529.1 geranylgeranyl reductase family protein [Gemmatimonadales bacterium]
MIDGPQPPEPNLHQVADRVWDAVVVGAGPAGSTAARCIAGHGHTVLLVDKQHFPRDKVCGDALISDALQALRRAGLYRRIRSHGYAAEILAAFSSSDIRVDVPGEFVTIRRRRLDQLLQEAAVASGAVFRVAEVASLRPEPDCISAAFVGSECRVRARVGVLATGADISLASRLGMIRQRQPSAVALRCYVRSPLTIDELIISFHRSIIPGYAWIFPLGNNEYNVGCGAFYQGTWPNRVNLRAAFSAFTQGFPPARQLLDAAESVSRLQGARLRCGLDREASYDGAHILSIGETIGTTFPFTGEGIGKAMETGELAALHITRALKGGDLGSLATFPRVLRDELAPRYVGYRVAANWLSKAWVNDFVARRVRRNPALRRAAAGVLNETVDPRTLFSWRLLAPRWIPWKARPAAHQR